MGRSHIKRIVVTLIIFFLFIWIVWLVIPESSINGYIKDSLEGRDIEIKLIGLKKGIFYTLRAEQGLILYSGTDISSSLSSQEIKPLIVIQDINLIPDLHSLIELTPRLNITGQINRGTINGTITEEHWGMALDIAGENIQVNGLPVIEKIGVYGEGVLKFNFQRKHRKGEITFSIDNAMLKGALTGISALPLHVFRNVKGLLTIGDNTIAVNSLTMEGKGVYARIKGNIRESNFEGNIEVMMDSSFDLYPILKSLLARYKVSEGFYAIPYVHKI
ncbi:MAG TPA: type II secretion system protein GspN [Syntrophales bacterium]|nr:type II secretion system protein GspN [Syntrophales bacterium]